MKPIISHFKERPKTALPWKALKLGVAAICTPPLMGIFGAVLRPMIDPVSVNPDNIGMGFGFVLAIASFALCISALVTSIKALRLGERSWVLWIGFIPATLVCSFWVFMLVGELVVPH